MVRVFLDWVDPGSATDPTVIHRRRVRLPSTSPAKRVSSRAELALTYLALTFFTALVCTVLLSNQIKIGHATTWMRTSACVSFMLRPSYFLSDLHRGLRASCETFAEKPNDAPSWLICESKSQTIKVFIFLNSFPLM